MSRYTIVPIPVLLGFALSLAIVAYAHGDTHGDTLPATPSEPAITAVPAAPVERDVASKSKAESEDQGGWLNGFKALFSWRVGDLVENIEVEPASASEGTERRSR